MATDSRVVPQDGGGAYVGSAASLVLARIITFSGNTAGAAGGGLYLSTDCELEAADGLPSTLNPQPSTPNPQPLTLNP